MSTVQTRRLVLRLPQESDAQPLMEIHEDPAVRDRVQMIAPPGGITVAWRNIAQMLGHWTLRGYGEWTVVEAATGTVVGRVGLNYPAGTRGVELGWIIRRDRWGQGLATEAARGAVDWAWSATPLMHILCTMRTDNLASIRVAEKLGARLEMVENTETGDILVYGLHRPM